MRMVRSAAGILLISAAALALTAYVLAAPVHRAVGAAPADLPVRSVQFQGAEGAILRGWFVPSAGKNGVVILLHGVRDNRKQMLGRARFLHRAGYSVLLYDSRASGESTGKAITFGYLESRDAQAAVRLAGELAPNQPRGVIGVSLGGAAASLAEPPLDVNALVLESVYPTIHEAIDDRLRIYLGPAHLALTPTLEVMIRPRLGFSRDALRPVDSLARLHTPKLIVFGTADRHTTLAESRRIVETSAEPKQEWPVAGAAHRDLYAFAGPEYEHRILAFFHDHLD